MPGTDHYEQLQKEKTDLQVRLEDAEEALHAIRQGEVDALVVSTNQGLRVFTLQSADHPYRLLVEQMQQGAVTISSDGTILYCNHCFAEILGETPSTLVSRPIDQYVVSEEFEALQAFLQTVSSGGVHHEFNFRSQTNQIVPVYISANLLWVDETEVICLVVTDLRERKKAEHQATELAIEKQRMKLLADFVRDTSHDLRTPITLILSGLYTLQHIKDEEKLKEKINKIENHILYLNRVLEQLQETAVIDSLTELPLKNGKISDVISDAIRSCEKQANEKQISFLTQVAPKIPPIPFDHDTLPRAIAELIKNAIHHTSEGGQIQICAFMVDDSYLMIEVTDDGTGIAPEHLPHIFKRFFKADESRSMSGGAGLGLSMAKRIVELHHGSIEVESIPGVRTSFKIFIPQCH